jgi:hypothetical protein
VNATDEIRVRAAVVAIIGARMMVLSLRLVQYHPKACANFGANAFKLTDLGTPAGNSGLRRYTKFLQLRKRGVMAGYGTIVLPRCRRHVENVGEAKVRPLK